MKKSDYQAALEPMQLELVHMAQWASATGQRILILIEGRDTAGKGGTIKTISQHLNPRQCRVVALPKPDDREKTEWYFQRYIAHLPAAGEIVLFDRSWYNRAGVEKVMGFATPEQIDIFFKQTPVFEQALVDDGILLFKYWLCCDQDKQEERFAERRDDPLKGWKLSPIDLKAREQYQQYTDARETMLKATHGKHTPWTLVDFNNQRVGRLTLIRDLLDRLPDTRIDEPIIALPPLQTKPKKERYDVIKPLKPFKP